MDSCIETLNVGKRTSVVWRYFERLSRETVRCKLCAHLQNYQGTTGNILRHLKSKHKIDATHNGQTINSSNVNFLSTPVSELEDRTTNKEYKSLHDDFEVIVKTEVNNAYSLAMPRQQRSARKINVHSYCENSDVDPYAETTIDFDDYIHFSSAHGPSDEGGQNGCKEKTKVSMEEERILAEIEYFREKAAYYRMQKNLTALQAKKVKFELDQMR